jgi:hypothetical protein
MRCAANQKVIRGRCARNTLSAATGPGSARKRSDPDATRIDSPHGRGGPRRPAQVRTLAAHPADILRYFIEANYRPGRTVIEQMGQRSGPDFPMALGARNRGLAHPAVARTVVTTIPCSAMDIYRDDREIVHLAIKMKVRANEAKGSQAVNSVFSQRREDASPR